jgi:hypothetical protein
MPNLHRGKVAQKCGLPMYIIFSAKQTITSLGNNTPSFTLRDEHTAEE